MEADLEDAARVRAAVSIGLNLWNAIQYIWRAGQARNRLETLLRARTCLDIEIAAASRDLTAKP